MSKKVTFAPDTKTFDGNSEILSKYGTLCIGFFNKKIKNIDDVISILGKDRKLLNKCIVESIFIREKLENLNKMNFTVETEEQRVERMLIIQKDIDNFDPFWDKPVWIMKANKYNKRKVPILRSGCRDSKISCYLEYKHLPNFIEFMRLLNNTDKFLFSEEYYESCRSM